MMNNSIIGGEFPIDYKNKYSNIKNQNTIFCASGRSALRVILEYCNTINKKKILIPDYLCSSITCVLNEISVPYDFYNVGIDLLPNIDSIFEKIEKYDILLLINYFGVCNLTNILETLKNKFPDKILISDNVQSFYSKDKMYADFSFNSYRKWFPVPEGANIISNNKLNLKYPIKINNFAKFKYAGNLLKNFPEIVEDEFSLNLLDRGEKLLNDNYNTLCTNLGIRIINNIDYKSIAEKRKQNAKILHKGLKNLNINHFYNENSVQLFVPILLENRNDIRKKMFNNKIFTPVHWPYESKELNGHTKNKLYDIELSLICDQRYGKKEMLKQLEILESCL